MEESCSGDGVQGILELETTGKVWSDFEGCPRIHLNDACADAAVFHGFLSNLKDFRRLDDRAAEFRSARNNHFTGFLPLLGKDHRDSGFQDPGFFGRDFAQRMAKEAFVGGIEAAAQADFEDTEIDALAGKMRESHGGDTLEIGWMGTQFARREELFDERMDVSESFGKGFVADFLAIDADAFVDFLEMRRSVESSSQTSMAKDGFEERGC